MQQVIRDPNRMIPAAGKDYSFSVIEGTKPMNTKLGKPRRSRRSKMQLNVEALDKAYQLKAPYFFTQIEYLEKEVRKLKTLVEQAKTPSERDKIAKDIDRLVSDLIIALS